MADKHWENQPRVPAGNENGGEWASGQSDRLTSQERNRNINNTNLRVQNAPQASDQKTDFDYNISDDILDFCNSLTKDEIQSTRGYSFF